MTTDTRRRERVVSTLSRRKAIAGGATLLTAGGTLVWVGQPASAAVSVDSFAVSDASFETDSLDPVVDVDVAFRYDAGDQPVDRLVLSLAIGETTVATETLTTSQPTGDATTTLSGRVADSDRWTLEGFAVGIGEDATREITVGLTFEVVDSSGGVIVSDSATDTAEIVVSHPQDSALTATVGGEGTITDANA